MTATLAVLAGVTVHPWWWWVALTWLVILAIGGIVAMTLAKVWKEAIVSILGIIVGLLLVLFTAWCVGEVTGCTADAHAAGRARLRADAEIPVPNHLLWTQVIQSRNYKDSSAVIYGTGGYYLKLLAKLDTSYVYGARPTIGVRLREVAENGAAYWDGEWRSIQFRYGEPAQSVSVDELWGHPVRINRLQIVTLNASRAMLRIDLLGIARDTVRVLVVPTPPTRKVVMPNGRSAGNDVQVPRTNSRSDRQVSGDSGRGQGVRAGGSGSLSAVSGSLTRNPSDQRSSNDGERSNRAQRRQLPLVAPGSSQSVAAAPVEFRIMRNVSVVATPTVKLWFTLPSTQQGQPCADGAPLAWIDSVRAVARKRGPSGPYVSAQWVAYLAQPDTLLAQHAVSWTRIGQADSFTVAAADTGATGWVQTHGTRGWSSVCRWVKAW